MVRVLKSYWLQATAIVVLIVIAIVVTLTIVGQQGRSIPSWVPIFGESFFKINAQLSTAQAITPGQGQAVDIAGVTVGYIQSVQLQNGHAVISMGIKPQYRDRIFKNASILLRPKTQLKDMIAQLSPGTPAAGKLDSGATIPIQQTLPDVDVDQVLAALDSDTRAFLVTLLSGLKKGLGGNEVAAANALRRLDPLARDSKRALALLGQRHSNLRRVITNLSLITAALGNKDAELARFVAQQNQFFSVLAQQEESIRAAVGELPSTLGATQSALAQASVLGAHLGPTLSALRPSARALAPALRDLQPFLRETTPVIESQLRPFARAAQQPVATLTPGLKATAQAVPHLTTSFKVINDLLNTLTYKSAKQESFLFYLAWANHIAATLYSAQDAHGPTRRGMFLASCAGLQLLGSLAGANQQLGTLIQLLNAPSVAEACAGTGSK